jgi:hypothetical protein
MNMTPPQAVAEQVDATMEADMPRFSRARHAPGDDEPVTAAVFEHAIGMVLDQIAELRADQAEAMATAIKAVLEDKQVAKKFVANAREALADSAINATGRSIWRMVGGLLEKWYLVALLALFALHTMGWGPAVALVKAVIGSKPA